MEYERPNPDKLLKLVNSDDEYSKRGHLKIFFGACAGVGKTYAMLSAIHEKLEDGVNVIVGVAETHGRPETEELLKNLPKLPAVETQHRGIKISEFDLEAALKAAPALIAIDELAHTNAPGSRHPKRWMDVEELLNAGIDVYSTLNVQHLESLNDIVADITEIRVKETVPDAIFDSANEITLVDISSEVLLERLKEGKVYVTELGKKRAAENFFRKENLLALRELALRRTAERVDAQNDVYTRLRPNKADRRASEKLAVCIGAGDLSPKLLRATKRLANGLRASWVAIYVENSRHYRLGQEAQLKLERNLRMAEELGAKTEIIRGDNASQAIMEYARANGVTKIVAGKPTSSRWREIWRGSLANDLVRLSGNIDVYVISGDEVPPPLAVQENSNSAKSLKGYLMAVVATAIATLLALPLKDHMDHDGLIVFYLISVLLVASKYGWLSSSVSALLGVLAFNFFFTEPYYSFNVYASGDIITLVMLLIASIIVGSKTSSLQAQSRFFERKERNTATLYSMSQELSATRGYKDLVGVISRHVEQSMDGVAIIWLANKEADFESVNHPELKGEVKEETVARWVWNNKLPAGIGTTTMPSARGFYIPLIGSTGIVGVLGLIPSKVDRVINAEEKHLLETLGTIAAASLERTIFADIAELSKVEAESERLRNTLLSSVSHDLRTPLASIKGVISSLLMKDVKLSTATKNDLLISAHDEVARLEHIVSNLLDITLLESGKLKLDQNYYFIQEIIGNALKVAKPSLNERKIEASIEENLPAIWADGLLLEQVIINLLENAAKYTKADTQIKISAGIHRKKSMQIKVEDNGAGIPEGQEEKIFDKFITISGSNERRGTGLGLAICRGIVKAHGGTIIARKANHGGAVFIVTLPLGQEPPENLPENE